MKNLYKIEDELYIVDNTKEINKDTKTCWCIDISCNELVLHQGVLPSYHYKNYKKIIMTTDESINVLCGCGKDCGAKESGVQAIDYEFLQWFVKNTSCDFVEIKELYFHGSGYYNSSELSEQEKEKYSFMKSYKITIPKEEPKQETLEEAAERLYPTTINSFTDSGFDTSETERLIFKNGAKWQQEKSYSYMEEYANYCLMCSAEKTLKIPLQPKEWIEQFKKK